MVLRIIVNGAHGKMGRLACDAIQQHSGFELSAGLSRADNLKQAIVDTAADVVVDLTRADCVYENVLTIIEAGAHPVIGTSGLHPDQMSALKVLCDEKKLGGLVVPNFSIAAVLMMRFAKMAAPYLNHVEIIEAHHPQKFDAPSGTAIRTAQILSKARTKETQPLNIHESIKGVRGGVCEDVPIHSIRLPGIVAEQQIVFGSLGETLTVTHRSIDRACFMPGLLLCCEKVQQLNTLYEDMDILFN